MLTKEVYDNLVSGELGYFINEYPSPWRQLRRGSHIDIFPGSFNPLHNGHLAIWNSIAGQTKFFEISIARYGKDPYPFDYLNEILAQFKDKYPVIITNHYDFLSKALLLRNWNINWNIGWDVASRINSMYAKSVLMQMGTFTVFHRKINNNIYNLNALDDKPSNFKVGTLIDNQYIGISSSQIRD